MELDKKEDWLSQSWSHKPTELIASQSVTWQPVPVRLFEMYAVTLLPLVTSLASCKPFTQEWPFCISEDCWVCISGRGKHEDVRGKGRLFYLPRWLRQLWSWGEHCFTRHRGLSAAFPWAAGKAGEWPRFPVPPGFAFRPEESCHTPALYT